MACIRKIDMLARIGGEDIFVLLLDTSLTEAKVTGEKLDYQSHY